MLKFLAWGAARAVVGRDRFWTLLKAGRIYPTRTAARGTIPQFQLFQLRRALEDDRRRRPDPRTPLRVDPDSPAFKGQTGRLVEKLLRDRGWRTAPPATKPVDPHAAADYANAQPHRDDNRAEIQDRYRQPTGAPSRPNPRPRGRYPACPDCDHGDCPTCRGNGEIMEAGQPRDCPCCCGTGDCRGCDGLGEVMPLDPDAPVSPDVERAFRKVARKFWTLYGPLDPDAPVHPEVKRAFFKLVEKVYVQTGIVI